MTLVAQNTRLLPALHEKLEALAGVDHAIIEEHCIWLVCQPQANASEVTEAAQAAIRSEGLAGEGLRVEALIRADQRDRERVRFEGVERVEEADMHVRVRVALEWKGKRAEGEATGEKGINIELRTAAQAALEALDGVSDRPVGVRLAGVKQVRAFDAELMVVSLYRPGPDFQKYLGAVLVGKEPLRAAALAVLHALNRLLGNYLVTR